MAEYVRMPKAHYEAACNSIRAKTGKEDLIKSGDMSAEIESITGGGGSSADVRYVTFMSYDGSKEEGKIPVAVGYDCPTPKFTPTRESTAQYHYTHYGWANTPNGGADANWYKAITEDKTVYANFSATLRSYTITFLDSDGSTLKSETMVYGTMPEYTPKKSGFEFTGWQPALATVTGNASYYAQWKELSGFTDVVTMVEADLPANAYALEYGKVAINNAGTLLAFALMARQNDSKLYPPVYNISDGTPVKVTGSGNINCYSSLSFNYDDTVLMAEGYVTSDYSHRVFGFTIDGLSSFSGSASSGATKSQSPIVCSPVADLYGYIRNPSGSNYYWHQSTGTEINLGNRVDSAAYSPDGEHLAIAKSGTGCKIYNIDGTLVADVSKFANTSATKVSYNSDGSLLAVSFSAAPWVAVYETENYTKVCDLSDILSATSYAEFMGSDILVVGTGKTVTVRTITETGHKAYEYNVPAYTESGDVVNIVKNHNGTRAVIQTTAKVTVWALS